MVSPSRGETRGRSAPSPPPDVDAIGQFLDEARRLLVEVDFLKEETEAAFMMRLSAWMGRRQITAEELSTLRGMVHRINLALKR